MFARGTRLRGGVKSRAAGYHFGQKHWSVLRTEFPPPPHLCHYEKDA